MRAAPARLLVLSLVAGVLLTGYGSVTAAPGSRLGGFVPAPASPSPTPGRVAGVIAPAPGEVEAIQQQIVDIHGDMLRVLQHFAQLDPQRQQVVSGMMIDLMVEEVPVMASLQLVADEMTPAERETAAPQVGRIRADIRDMYGLTPGDESGPDDSASAGVGSIVEMGQQIEELHRLMLVYSNRMTLEQVEGVAANMVDITGDMDRLKAVMGPALGRIGPGQRRALKQQLDAMQTITQEMVRVAAP